MTNCNDGWKETSIEEVFEALRTEREYQRRRWGVRDRTADGGYTMVEPKHCTCDFLLYMQDYLTAAIKCAAREPGYDGARAELQKVVTLGVACLEQHGVKLRDLTGGVVNARDNLPA